VFTAYVIATTLNLAVIATNSERRRAFASHSNKHTARVRVHTTIGFSDTEDANPKRFSKGQDRCAATGVRGPSEHVFGAAD